MICKTCHNTGLIEILSIVTQMVDKKEFRGLKRETFACMCGAGKHINNIRHYDTKGKEYTEHEPFDFHRTDSTWKEILDENMAVAREYRKLTKEARK